MSEAEDDHPLGRSSAETTMNLNGDLASSSDFSSNVPKKATESVFSSMRSSMDGSSSVMNAFNILKQGSAVDDDVTSSSSHPLGPNSIFGLTIGSDVARLRMHRGLKSQVTINGGKTIVSHLMKPSTEDIPQITLMSLKNKVSNTELTHELVTDTLNDYKNFELGYRSLTEDMLSKLSEQVESRGGSDLDNMEMSLETDVSLIPAVFEDPDFRLDDPRIFRQVMQNSKLLPDKGMLEDSSTHLVNDSAVQEKLSQYLDMVEVQLIQEISKTSDSFFSALGEIEEVEKLSQSSIDKFNEVKQKLKDIEEGQAEAGSKILDLLDERKSVNHLESSILQIQAVLSRYADARVHYKQGDNFKCLQDVFVIEDLIAGVESEVHEDPANQHNYPKFKFPLVDLLNLPALANLRAELQDLKLSCTHDYSEQFVQSLLHDLRSHYKSIPHQDTLNRIYVSVNRARRYQDKPVNRLYVNVDPQTKTQLQTFVYNLSRSGFLTQAFSEYQTRAISEVKAIIRSNLPSAKADAVLDNGVNSKDKSPLYEIEKPQLDTSTSTSASLSANIKNLSPDEFARMMTTTYVNLAECFRRLTIHQKLLLDLSLSSLSPSLAQSIDVMSLDITTAVNKAIELSQIRLVKILNVRLEQIGDLPVDQYLHLFLISSAYLLECESINPGFVGTSTGSSLTEWVKNHVGYFIHRFHSNSVKNLAVICDKETWREYILPEKIGASQRVLDTILGFAEYVDSGGEKGYEGNDWVELLNFYEDDTQTSQARESDTVESNLSERLKIKGQEFLVPQMLLGVVENVCDYLKIIKIYSSRGNAIRANLLIYFKLMNSRISLAILNAGATRTAGLKHITTKHLALCIQTISFTIGLLTEIQPIFADDKFEFSQNQNGAEDLTIEKIISYYRDHHKELHDKLVSIMHDRTLNHCLAVTKLDLSQPLKHPQQCHSYMETLVKETTTVSKVLTKYLPLPECSFILLQIFNNYKTLLVKCYCMDLPQFKDFNEKQNLLKDVDYFRVRLSELPGYGNSGQVIWENVNSLPTIEDSRMDEIMRANIASERAIADAASAKTLDEVAEPVAVTEQSRVTTEVESNDEEQKKTEAEPAIDEANKSEDLRESVEVEAPQEKATAPAEGQKETKTSPLEDTEEHKETEAGPGAEEHRGSETGLVEESRKSLADGNAEPKNVVVSQVASSDKDSNPADDAKDLGAQMTLDDESSMLKADLGETTPDMPNDGKSQVHEDKASETVVEPSQLSQPSDDPAAPADEEGAAHQN